MNAFFLLFISIVVSTTTIIHDAEPGRSKAFIDDGNTRNESHLVMLDYFRDAVLVDSSGNGYSAWGQIHECLAYNPFTGSLQFVSRGYSPTGMLNVSTTDSVFSYWIYDYAAYNQEYGPARYPHSINSGYLCFPVLPGYMIAMQLGGAIEDIGPGDLGVYRVVGTQVANSNMLFIGCNQNNDIIFRSTSSDLQTPIAQGTIAYDCGLIGFDYNDTLGYIFYYDSLNIYYRRINASGGFSPESIYNMVWPNPYSNNLIFWTQMAVTDAGNPILVFDNLDNDDYSTGTYPYFSKVYISTGSGMPCVEASTPYTKSWYPTVAANGNDVVVLFHAARENSGIDSLAFFDLIAAVSIDNGSTFTYHHNLTGSLPNRPGLAQISKRFAADLGRFYYFYGINMTNNHDPIWHLMRDPEGLDPHAWYVGWHEIETGIAEERKQNVDAQNSMLAVYPNPFFKQTNIRYMMQDSRCTIMEVFDAAGRSVRSFDLGSCIMNHESVITWHGDDNHGHTLPPGVYFVKLQGESLADIDKMIKVQ